MIDHLELQTRHLDTSAKFYGDVLAPLGYVLTVDGPAKGFGDGTALDLFLVEGEPSSHVHFAFGVPSRSNIDQGLCAGRSGRTPARPRPSAGSARAPQLLRRLSARPGRTPGRVRLPPWAE